MAAGAGAAVPGAEAPLASMSVGVYDWLLVALCPVALYWLWRRDAVRPGSLARRGARGVESLDPVLLLAGCFLVLLTQGVATSGVAAALGVGDDPTLRQRAISVAAGASAAAVAALVFAAFIRRRAAAVAGASAPAGRRRTGMILRPRELSAGIPWLLAVFPIVTCVMLVSTLIASAMGVIVDPIAHEALNTLAGSGGDPWAWLLAAAAIIAAPVLEECLYRGFLQSLLRRLTASPALSICITATLFGLVHRAGDAVPWHAIPALVVLGALFGIAYEKTGKLAVPIAMHAGFNAVNVAMTVVMTG